MPLAMTLGLQAAPDTEIIDLATAEDRIVVSADTDFGTILTLRGASKPSFVLFRGDAERRPASQAAALMKHLPEIEGPLESGAIVVISAARIRIRQLPVRSE